MYFSLPFYILTILTEINNLLPFCKDSRLFGLPSLIKKLRPAKPALVINIRDFELTARSCSSHQMVLVRNNGCHSMI